MSYVFDMLIDIRLIELRKVEKSGLERDLSVGPSTFSGKTSLAAGRMWAMKGLSLMSSSSQTTCTA